MIYGIVSGYFNPVHSGHIDYFEEAKKHCDYLFAIVNNDQQVKVKGSKPFMDESERQKIISSIRYVDEAMISIDTDASVSRSIAYIVYKLNTISWVMFFNSGDRDPETYNIAESDVCERLGVIPFFLELPKVNSSSKLLK